LGGGAVTRGALVRDGALVTDGAAALVVGRALAVVAESWTLGANPTSEVPGTVGWIDAAALAGGFVG
jgi:hypothetical protein